MLVVAKIYGFPQVPSGFRFRSSKDLTENPGRTSGSKMGKEKKRKGKKRDALKFATLLWNDRGGWSDSGEGEGAQAERFAVESGCRTRP